MNNDLVYRLRKRAEIRRQIPHRKSVMTGEPDRIADLLEEAADALESVPVAWRTFDGEGGWDYRDYELNENYHQEYIARNGDRYSHWVEPLYKRVQKS